MSKENALKQVKYANDAKEYMHLALQFDEKGEQDSALANYLQAIEIYQLCFGLQFTKEEAIECQPLTQKLHTNMRLAKMRAEELSELISQSSKPLKKSGGIFSSFMESLSNTFMPSEKQPQSAPSPQTNAQPMPELRQQPSSSMPRTQYVPKPVNPSPSVKSTGSSTNNPNPPAIPLRKPSNNAPTTQNTQKKATPQTNGKDTSELYPELRNVEKKFQEMILNEVVEHKPNVKWSDIQGLENAKRVLKEVIILPSLRPELFTGLRAPPKGVLFFGPPGCGKTLLAKAVATEAQATFFSISASSLTSKYLGESEKLVRALFAIARVVQPSIIFIDEIDSILSQRGSNEHEASRRLKTEFLIQLDGATTSNDDRIVVIAATNLPDEIDEAARRRLVKRIYIPLPDYETRKHQIQHLMSSLKTNLTSSHIDQICRATEGYSGSDIKELCKEAAMGPLRGLEILDVSPEKVRPINLNDFKNATNQIRPSVSRESISFYEKWNKEFGSF